MIPIRLRSMWRTPGIAVFGVHFLLSLRSLCALTVLSCVDHSDLDEADQNGMKLINVSPDDDDDDESYHALHRDVEHDEYDSDSTSVPIHIKRINTLQRKVRQLEATLKQFNEQEPASRRRDSVDDEIMGHHVVSDGAGYQPRTQGNIV